VLVCLALVLLAALPSSAAAATPSEVEAAKASAVQWIKKQQEPTGQIPGFGGDWAATALAAAGVDVASVRVSPGDPSLQDHLLDEYTSGEWIEPPGTGPFPMPVTEYERATLASYAAGLDPARLSAVANMPAQIAALWDPTTGSFGAPSSNGTAFAILALASTPLPNWALQPAVSYLRRNQHDDGGWEFGPATTPAARATPSTAEMTGAALAAFCEAGVPAYDAQVAEGIEFLQQELADNAADDGGFEYPWGGPNADTNAWAVSGLSACGIDPQSAEWTTSAGKTPLDYLLARQLSSGPDEGSFEYFGFPALYTSQSALRAISGAVFTAVPPSLRTPASVPTGTPVPHTLALDLGTHGVRVCKVTAAAGVSLTALLDVAKTTAAPTGCVNSVEVTAGKVTSIDGVAPANADESWLLRLDRGPQAIAGEQPVAFGDVVSLRIGIAPIGGQETQGIAGPAGSTGPAGKPGKNGKRGSRGRPGRNASISCQVRHRAGKKHRVRCVVKHHKRG
jgi:hypothetical protein